MRPGARGPVPSVPAVLTALLATVLTGTALTGCTGAAGTDDPDADATGDPVATPDYHEPTGTHDADPVLHGPVRVELTTGSLDDGTDALVGVIRRYVAARTQSLRDQRLVPAMVHLSTFTWLLDQREVMLDAKRRGWTVPADPTVSVEDVTVQGPDALAEVCLWEPSTGFVARRTGAPVGSAPDQWTPFDVKMVQIEDGWLVDGAALGDHECSGG